jgi:hypothetical protein
VSGLLERLRPGSTYRVELNGRVEEEFEAPHASAVYVEGEAGMAFCLGKVASGNVEGIEVDTDIGNRAPRRRPVVVFVRTEAGRNGLGEVLYTWQPAGWRSWKEFLTNAQPGVYRVEYAAHAGQPATGLRVELDLEPMAR